MPRTMAPTVGEFTREDRRVVSLWLGLHLPEARRLARGVTPEEAASGVAANPSTGTAAIPPVGVSPRTIRNIEAAAEKGPGYAPQEAQVKAILRWVEMYLGYGPEKCRLSPCPICGAKGEPRRPRR